jgi:hypothetical protein
VAAWELSHGLGLTTAAAPLLALAAGLDDLGNGRAPDWMRPTNVGGTSLLGRSERWVRAVAVDTLEQLSARGLRPAEAAGKVAGAIKAGRGPSDARRAVTAETVLRWRERRASLTGDEPVWRGEVSAKMQAEAGRS